MARQVRKHARIFEKAQLNDLWTLNACKEKKSIKITFTIPNSTGKQPQ
jgi:hypothetical protein